MKQFISSLLTLSALAGCDPSSEPDGVDASAEELAPGASTAPSGLRDASADPTLARLAFRPDAAGGFVGANSDTVRVDARGLGVRLGQDTLRFTLQSWGRSDARLAAGPAEPRLGACVTEATTPDTDCARRVEQPHGALTAWVARREGAVEQGWTLSERPEGAGPVELHLAVTGGELLEVEADAAVLATTGVNWRYTGLKAWDATGKHLPVHLQRSPGGLAVVVDDTDARYPIEIDPSLYATSVKLTPLEPQDSAWVEKYNYGVAIRDVGDLDGDGYDDVAVGAPLDLAYDAALKTLCRHQGRVYLYFGGPLGVDPQSEKILDPHEDGSYGFWKKLFPNSFPTGDKCRERRFGADIAAADLDQDGKQDLVIGAPGTTSASGLNFPNQDWGRVWTYATAGWYETPGAIPLFLRDGWGCALWEQVGTSVDVRNIQGGSGSGAFGLATAPARTDLGGGNFTEYAQAFGNLDDAWAGNTCAAAIFTDAADGEINDATYDLFGHRARVIGATEESWAIGAPLHGDSNEGRVYVGGFDAQGSYYYSALDELEGVKGGQFGRDLDDAGDVNGDGYNDLIVGAPGSNGSGPASGAAYFYPSSGATVPYFSESDFLMVAPPELQPFDAFGAVAGVGDLNGDGYDDLLFGAPNTDLFWYGSNTGRAYVMFGGPSGPDMYGAVPLSPPDIQANDFFGHRVSAAGDVDGNGRPDLMVSACDVYSEELNNDGEMQGWCSGAVYVFQTF